MSLTYESAGSQRSCTAKTSTASVATRNSGTETIATAPVDATRSNHEPRHTAAAMPSVSAIGTENKRGDRREQQRVGQAARDQLGDRQLRRRRKCRARPRHSPDSQRR